MTERESRTFDFGEDRLERATFEDIQSTADRFLIARGGIADVDMRRIDHRPNEPLRRDKPASRWSKITQVARILAGVVAALAGVATIVAFVVARF